MNYKLWSLDFSSVNTEVNYDNNLGAAKYLEVLAPKSSESRYNISAVCINLFNPLMAAHLHHPFALKAQEEMMLLKLVPFHG